MSSSSSSASASPGSPAARSPPSGCSPAAARRLRGGGFKPDLHDAPPSQTRHFAGIARAVTVFGPHRTLWLSEHVRRDTADSPDGRLSALAVEFASSLLDGSLAIGDAGEWIRANVCATGG